MLNDAELLRTYAMQGSEPAFAEFVQRHLDLVYFAALRRCRGDAHLAEDVTQQVFTLVARRAASLASHAVLAGWLYVTTRNVASKLMRAEDSRRSREQSAHRALAADAAAEPSAQVDWERLRPVLDGALDELGERDRDAVLLRFFENRAFAEIGAALRVTEDAARMRVDRALGKLRARLERRGLPSTNAALAAALANGLAHAKPAGLAASVTSSALAGAAAAGGLTGAAALTGIGFMATMKLSGGAVAAGALLLASLAGNAYLALAPARVDAAAIRAGDATPRAAAAAPESSAEPPTTLALVQHADLAALRDRLRAAGASDVAVRAALEGILRQRYRERLSANIAARLRHWWRDDTRTWGTANDTQLPFPDLRLMHEMIERPLEALLGVDPAAAAETEARYAFLPAEAREALARLDRASVGGFSTTGDPGEDARIRKEFFEEGRRRQEERKGVIATLAPEQRLEYEMRYGPFASDLRRQFENLVVTEQEFRAVFPLAERYAAELKALPRHDDPNAAKFDLDRDHAQRLVQSLGFERALDYIWAGAAEYPSIARVVRDAGLPPHTAGKVVQLAAETAERASALHQDGAKTDEEKRAGLIALQRAARVQLDAWVPSAAQQRLGPTALAWLHVLGESAYKPILTTMPGHVRAFMGTAPVSIDRPAAAPHLTRQLVPQRPSGN